MSWRDLRCGEPRPDQVGRRLTLAGWVDTRRDHIQRNLRLSHTVVRDRKSVV